VAGSGECGSKPSVPIKAVNFLTGERTCWFLVKESASWSQSVKVIPIHAWTGLLGSRRFRIPEVLDSRHTKAARLSTLHAGRLYPQEITLWINNIRN
jgi:hypothetical protein